MFTSGTLLANDTGVGLSVVSVGPLSLAGGTVVSNGGGNFTFTPAIGFAGVDLFTYTIVDTGGLTALGTVTVTVPDITLPIATITAPTAGATVSGVVTVTGSAVDNVGVVSLEVRADGVIIGTASPTSPISRTWNTVGLTNGNHSLTAVARDAANNVGTSIAVVVNVNNAVAVLAPIATAGANLTVASAALVTLSGTGVDPNVPARALTLAWTQTAGTPTVVLTPTSAAGVSPATATFTAPTLAVGATPIVLTFTLTVNNGATPAATSSKTVTVNPPAAAGGTIGLTTIGASLDTGDSNFLNGSLVTTTTASAISSMSVFVGAIDTVVANRLFQVAIYTNVAGRPGTLVASSASGTLVANSVNTVAITAALPANTSFWLMYNTNGRTATVNNMFFNTAAAGQGVFSTGAVAFGTWPAAFPASTLTTLRYSLFATFP